MSNSNLLVGPNAWANLFIGDELNFLTPGTAPNTQFNTQLTVAPDSGSKVITIPASAGQSSGLMTGSVVVNNPVLLSTQPGQGSFSVTDSGDFATSIVTTTFNGSNTLVNVAFSFGISNIVVVADTAPGTFSAFGINIPVTLPMQSVHGFSCAWASNKTFSSVGDTQPLDFPLVSAQQNRINGNLALNMVLYFGPNPVLFNTANQYNLTGQFSYIAG